jgi:hypothetical protein
MTSPVDPTTEPGPSSPGRDRDGTGQPAHDVFVSYSTHDKPIADAIVSRLEQAGIRCWVAPRDIIPGQLWGEAILRAIETARLMVVVVSGAANGSRQVIREVERAVANDVVVIPFRIESIEPTGAMAYYLASEHWLDAMTPPLESHISHLVSVGQALLGTMSSTRVRAPATVAGQAPHPVQPTPAAAPRARRHMLIAGIVAVPLLAILGLVGALALAPSSPATPSSIPEAPRSILYEDIATGDCLLTPDEYADDEPNQARFWRDVPGGTWPLIFRAVSCDEPHGAEAYFVGDRWEAEATYPGDGAIFSQWIASCEREFQAYIGAVLGESSLDLNGWTQDADGWAQGLRWIACIAYDRSGADLVGSIRGTAR